MLDTSAFRFMTLHSGDVIDVRVLSVTDTDLVICQLMSAKEEFDQLIIHLQETYCDTGRCCSI